MPSTLLIIVCVVHLVLLNDSPISGSSQLTYSCLLSKLGVARPASVPAAHFSEVPCRSFPSAVGLVDVAGSVVELHRHMRRATSFERGGRSAAVFLGLAACVAPASVFLSPRTDPENAFESAGPCCMPSQPQRDHTDACIHSIDTYGAMFSIDHDGQDLGAARRRGCPSVRARRHGRVANEWSRSAVRNAR